MQMKFWDLHRKKAMPPSMFFYGPYKNGWLFLPGNRMKCLNILRKENTEKCSPSSLTYWNYNRQIIRLKAVGIVHFQQSQGAGEKGAAAIWIIRPRRLPFG